MEWIKIYKELAEIPQRKYQGYIWKSDQEYPEVLQEPKLFEFKDNDLNPFIQEALLYCREENASVMVRHTGAYQITEFDLNKIPNEAELKEKKYYPHRLNIGSKKVCISQLWFPEKDENCDGMEVLTIKAHVFTGFSNESID